MNTQKFKNNGHNKFPISTETLDFMQEQIKLVYGLASLAGQNIIIRMPSVNTPGLVIINGELLPLTGSANTYITIIESSSSITFSGETISEARTTKTAQFTSYSAGANSIAFTSVVSMRTNRQLQLDLASARQHHTPKGTVIDWYGEASCDNIPYGWVPCGGFFKTSGGVYQGQGSIPAAITTEKNKWLARYPGATITEQFHYGSNNTYLKITNIPDFGAIPNLSHRFIVGAGYDGNSGAYDLSATGGADSVTLTAAQFASAFDSFWHKLENIPISAITNLQSELNAKANTTDVNTALAGKADLSHSHSMSEVNGLGTALSGLQNKNDSNLQTSNQSIVGAINEVRGSVLGLASQLTDIIHAYTIDFQTGRTIVQERNLHGSVKLTKIVTDNVASLHLSINGTAQTIALSSGTWNGNIAIADNDLLAWSISRSTEGSIAEINIKYEYNS